MDGLSELPEVNFEFPFTLIGKSTMAFLTDQSRRIPKCWYLGEGPEQGFRRCFADGLNQSLVSSVTQVQETVLWKGFAVLKQLVSWPFC